MASSNFELSDSNDLSDVQLQSCACSSLTIRIITDVNAFIMNHKTAIDCARDTEIKNYLLEQQAIQELVGFQVSEQSIKSEVDS